jgi:hypothetical protein
MLAILRLNTSELSAFKTDIGGINAAKKKSTI